MCFHFRAAGTWPSSSSFLCLLRHFLPLSTETSNKKKIQIIKCVELQIYILYTHTYTGLIKEGVV